MPTNHKEPFFMVHFCVSVLLVYINQWTGFCFVLEARFEQKFQGVEAAPDIQRWKTFLPSVGLNEGIN